MLLGRQPKSFHLHLLESNSRHWSLHDTFLFSLLVELIELSLSAQVLHQCQYYHFYIIIA